MTATEIAWIDVDGVIVAANDAWHDFTQRNGGDAAACGIGASYLDECDRAGDATSAAVATAIRAAIDGQLPQPFVVLLPCDSATASRWFSLTVSCWADETGITGAVVALRQLVGAADVVEVLATLGLHALVTSAPHEDLPGPLATIMEMAAELNRSTDLPGALAVLARTATALLQADAGAVFLANAGGTSPADAGTATIAEGPVVLRCVATVGPHADRIYGRTVTVEQGSAVAHRLRQRAAFEVAPIAPAGERPSPDLFGASAHAGVLAGLVNRQGGLLGALAVWWRTQEDAAGVSPVDRRWLDVAMAHASSFVEAALHEEGMRRNDRRLRLALDALGAGTWAIDLHARTITFDARAAELTGAAANSALRIDERLRRSTAADAMLIRAVLGTDLVSADVASGEVAIDPAAASDVASLAWVRRATRDAERRVVQHVGLVWDVTALRRRDADRLAISATLEAALASMGDAVFISDAHGALTLFNDAFVSFHRFSSSTECAQRLREDPELLELHHADGSAVLLDQWAVPRALRGETGTDVEFTVRRKDSGDRWIGSYNFGPIRTSSGEIVGSVVTGRDVTQQRLAERHLADSEARLRSIIDTATDAIVVCGASGAVESVNGGGSSLFGRSAPELSGMSMSMLVADLEEPTIPTPSPTSAPSSARRMTGRRADGSSFPADVVQTWWMGSDGNSRCTWIVRDVTEQVRRDREHADARRLESIGQLAGGVAHDFNNLLAVIGGSLELAERRTEDVVVRRHLQRALEAVRRGDLFNRRLLTMASQAAPMPELLDLNERVADVLELLAGGLGERFQLVCELDEELWMTYADHGEIDSALINLATNARDAMPSGGTLTVSTWNERIDRAESP